MVIRQIRLYGIGVLLLTTVASTVTACSGDTMDNANDEHAELDRSVVRVAKDQRVVIGTSRNERFYGTNLADSISGKGGDDEFLGGQGPDVLMGGVGSDRYLFARGDGKDVVEDEGGTEDEVVLEDGVTFEELFVFEDSAGLNIQIGPKESGDSILIPEWGWFDNYVEFIVTDANRYDVNAIEKKISGNRRPKLAQTIPKQSAVVGQAFHFRIPEGAFVDSDEGDTLNLIEYMRGGDLLPTWLRFDPDLALFSGTPTAADIGTLVIHIRANDPGNRVAIGAVEITISQAEQ